jgi:hypothetical protein
VDVSGGREGERRREREGYEKRARGGGEERREERDSGPHALLGCPAVR